MARPHAKAWYGYCTMTSYVHTYTTTQKLNNRKLKVFGVTYSTHKTTPYLKRTALQTGQCNHSKQKQINMNTTVHGPNVRKC